MASVSFILVAIQFLILALEVPPAHNSNRCSSCMAYVSGKEYPGCLDTSYDCPSGHLCSIIYKPNVPLSNYLSMGCTSGCLPYTTNPSDKCIHGGDITSFGSCIMCCQNSRCRQRFKHSTHGLTTTSPTTTVNGNQIAGGDYTILCPTTCTSTDSASCQSNGKMCNDDEFCNMVYNLGSKRLEGQCTVATLKPACNTYNRTHHCPFILSEEQTFMATHTNLYGYCYYGCCETNSCIKNILTTKPSTTTTAFVTVPTRPAPITHPTQTTVRTTKSTTPQPTPKPTPTPTNTYNYAGLMTSCVDKLQGSICATLRDTKDICRAPLGATLCPVTCNICQYVKSIVCQDKTLANDCITLSSKPGFCKDDMAIYICPKSCNLCNELVKAVVDEVLFASPTPDFNNPLSTPPTLHCKELLQSDCQHVRDVCNHSNLHDVCPDECKTCS